MTRALFLSIKPRYARSILEGRKTIEVRRKFPDLPAGTTIVLYSSSPERAIVGTVRLKQASKLPPDRVWELHSDAIDIAQDALGEYLEGADASTLLEVEHPRAWGATSLSRFAARPAGIWTAAELPLPRCTAGRADRQPRISDCSVVQHHGSRCCDLRCGLLHVGPLLTKTVFGRPQVGCVAASNPYQPPKRLCEEDEDARAWFR
ncbi:ASCH domain-containing protein [Microbacterium oxydans]|nr:ASCH domain-containing protein [Microbacterium oxydans]